MGSPAQHDVEVTVGIAVADHLKVFQQNSKDKSSEQVTDPVSVMPESVDDTYRKEDEHTSFREGEAPEWSESVRDAGEG